MDFRTWLIQMWEEHKLEVESWQGRLPCYNAAEYFQKYKWWLKREYKYQMSWKK